MFSICYNSRLILFSLITLIIISAYWSSLSGPFVFDDQLNIVENPGVAINELSFTSLKTAFLSNHSGMFKRVLPALSFGINHYFAEGFSNTYVFKLFNLCIHLINSALVFWVSYLLLSQIKKIHSDNEIQFVSEDNETYLVWLVALITLTWTLHPIQLTSVAYVVQRMTSMAATFVLLGLILYVTGRNKLANNFTAGLILMGVGIICGTILGLMCKENAVLLFMYAGTIEFTLYNRKALSSLQTRKLCCFYSVFFFLPLLIGLYYCFFYSNILSGYNTRPFSLSERLLTEPRILWLYLQMLFFPDITTMGLFHDDIPKSTGWLQPITTIWAILSWLALSIFAFILKKRIPVFSFAILWYLVGHSLESSVIPLLLVFEHRNYLPSLGPIILFCYLVGQSFAFFKTKLWEFVTVLLIFFWITGLYHATFSRANNWKTENTFIAANARNHPFSPSSQYLYGELLYKKLKQPLAAYPYYYRAAQLEPDEVGFLISLTMVTPVNSIINLKQLNVSSLANPEKITELLKNRPVSAWGIRALDVASQCVKEYKAPCKMQMNNVRKWLFAISSNPFLGKKERRHFVINLVDIELQNNLYKEALRTIISVKEEDTFFRYHLMHADILATLGFFSEAIGLLESIKQDAFQSTLFQSDLLRLKLAITKLASQQI